MQYLFIAFSNVSVEPSFFNFTEIMNNFSRFFVFIAVFAIVLIQDSWASVVSTGDFNKDFFVTWSPSHVNTSVDGTNRNLILDKYSGLFHSQISCKLCLLTFSSNFVSFFPPGSGFASNDMFLFGQFDMKIKLIPGNSAGTVVAFYVSR